MIDILQSAAILFFSIAFLIHIRNDIKQADDLWEHFNERIENIYNLIYSKLKL